MVDEVLKEFQTGDIDAEKGIVPMARPCLISLVAVEGIEPPTRGL